LNPANPEAVRIQAGKEFFNRLNRAVQDSNNILIESTLSGKTLAPILEEDKEAYNYSIIVIFVYVSNAEVCTERVAIRVQKGGHNVPTEDIKRRFERSLSNFWHNYRLQSDQWYLYNNSEDGFQEVARYVGNDIIVLDERLFVIFKEIIKENE
jgi:predicted ABC-type ATPase